MQEINLRTGFGSHPLNYPHWTKYDKEKKQLYVVTKPDRLIEPGDVVYDGFKTQTPDGEPKMKYNIPYSAVGEVIEQRPAKGDHKTDFKPVFQLLQLL